MMRFMKRLLALVIWGAIFVVSSARGQSADDQYMRVYGLIQQGDALNEGGQTRDALAKYAEAQTNLWHFERSFPDWNAQVIKFRENYLTKQIADLGAKVSQQVATNSVPETAPAVSNTGVVVTKSEEDARLNALRIQVSTLEMEKQNLEAKLKEAFAMQPAAADPGELAKAEENVRALQKENDLLKTTLAQAQSTKVAPTDTKAVAELKQKLEESNQKLQEATEKTARLSQIHARDLAIAQEKSKSLQLENDLLKTKLAEAQTAAATSGDNKAAEDLKRQLEESNQRLAEANQRAARLAAEKQAALQPKPVSENPVDAALRAENDTLRQQLARLKMPEKSSTNPGDLQQQLAEARAEIAALQSDAEILQLEKMALANRDAQPVLSSNAVVAARPPAAKKVQPVTKTGNPQPVIVPKATVAPEKLAKASAVTSPPIIKNQNSASQRDEQLKQELLKKLATSQQQPADQKTTETANSAAPIPSRNKSEEAASVPKPEEMAMFKEPAASLSTNFTKLSSAQASQILSDAQGYFASGQLNQAEQSYLQVLRDFPTNVLVLADLAAIEIELNQLAQAEQHVQQAMKFAPNDAYSISVLGNLRLHQENYPAALDALNRAAKINPDDARIQNYLGVTLSHMGRRTEAEAALRKAVQLDPKYGGAHNNLAVLYLTEQPPFVGLARWHYQKALAAGFPRNPEFEKALETNSTVGAQ